ncbi:MAG: rhodanese-like domain-containing protein [Chloroflexi bacterium]|nr:rhodanese-like domain-containing protein [Chloroflexota bacterium]MCA2002225.1 rhodanese-like domain-containing protein [Chloroflexota bacterium]
MSKKRKNTQARRGLSAYLRKPAVQLGLVALVALLVFAIASAAGGAKDGALARDISVDEAYRMYKNGVFLLDVRTQEEWDEYHVPNATLIPLDELPNRLNEIPQGKEVVVICRSGNRSQEGRDILLNAGYNAASVIGGIKEWYAKGYDIEGAPAQ